VEKRSGGGRRALKKRKRKKFLDSVERFRRIEKRERAGRLCLFGHEADSTKGGWGGHVINFSRNSALITTLRRERAPVGGEEGWERGGLIL